MDPSAAGNDVFTNAINALFTPLGILGAFLGIVVAIAALTSRGWRWALLALALWIATFELAAEDTFNITSLWGPLEVIRSNDRLLATGCLLALLMPSLFSNKGWRSKTISGAAVAFLVLEFVYSGRLAMAGLTTRAISSIGIFLLIFVILTRGVATWLQTPAHAVAAIRAIALAGALFVGTNAFQLLIGPRNVIWNGRLNGTAGNAQHMAMDIASFLPAIIYILLRREEPKSIRLCLAGSLGLLVILLGMTASRTGALMTLVAVVVMLRSWLGKFLRLALVACVFTFIAMLIFPDAPIQTDRFTSTEDTRSAVWSQLISEFVNHPLLGIVYGEPQIRESSYLSVAARLGLAGAIPFAIMIYLTLRSMRKLRWIRSLLGEDAIMVDVVTAGFSSLAVGAATEGFVLGTLTLQVYMIYIYLTLAYFLIDLGTQRQYALASQDESSYETEYEEFHLGAYDL